MVHPTTSTSRPTLTSIQDVLTLILQCGDNLSLIRTTLLPALQKLASDPKHESDALLSRSVRAEGRESQDPFGLLSAHTHTLGYLFLLTAWIKAAPSQGTVDVTLQAAGRFAQEFDVAQAKLAGYQVVHMARELTRLDADAGAPPAVTAILETLLRRYTEGRTDCLTALHGILAYQYLRNQGYQAAYESLLTHDLIEVDRSALPGHSDVLEYYYYAGMILTKLGRHEQAIDAFETCISVPSAAVSAIQMDAYKKLVLVQLLAHGKTSPPPRYTAQAITRSFKQLGAAYSAFAAAYESRDPQCVSRLEAVVNERTDQFAQDRNFGLVYQCLELHRQRRIQRLAEVYSSLTLRDVADWLDVQGPDREEAVASDVAELVRKGWVYATVQPASAVPPGRSTLPSNDSPVIVFSQPEERYESVETIGLLTRAIQRYQSVQAVVEERERKVARSEAFLRKQAQAKGNTRYFDVGNEEFEDDVYAA